MQDPLAVYIVSLVEEAVILIRIHIRLADFGYSSASGIREGLVLIDFAECPSEIQKQGFDVLFHHTLLSLSQATYGALGKMSFSSLKSKITASGLLASVIFSLASFSGVV